MEAYHTLYRPIKFSQVMGQDAVIKSLQQVIADKSSQAFLFSGPSGVGKTTLSRLTAKALGITDGGLMELDAATNTSVDDVRRIQGTIQYRAFGKNGNRAIIWDECHRLSKQAFDALLKSVEEPPDHLYWFFCTTEPGRVPDTIRTRCTAFSLKPLSDKHLSAVVQDICDLEKIKLRDGVLEAIIKEAKGSPRQALVNLALVRSATSKKEAAEMLRSALESDPTIKLAKFLVFGKDGSWGKAMDYVAQLTEENQESVRIVICNYIAGCLQSAKNDRDAVHFLSVLDAFADAYNPSEGSAPLMQSIGRVLFRG